MNVRKTLDGLIFGTIGSIRSVFRHKQRSFALMAGMILGAGILGGIFIYTDIVNEANFSSIVKGVNYEVRFDLKGTPTAKDNYSLNSIKDYIKTNSLVEDAVIMYGQSAQKVVQTSTSVSSYSYNLQAVFPESGSNPQSVNDILGTEAFLINESSIKNSLIFEGINNTIYQGKFDVSNNGIVIPQTIADTNQLLVGSTTNVTLYVSTSGSNYGPAEQYNLTNAVVRGIYNNPTSSNLFTNIFNQQKIYASLNEVSKLYPALKQKLDNEQMGFIAVKINPNKLSLSDSAKASTEINQFISTIEKKYQGIVIGTNEVSTALLGSQVFSVFIVFFDLFLTLPVFLLGIYLITFGAQMALDDRKKEIAIYKIQGASSEQIMRSVFGEIIILIIIGSVLGYIISVLVGLSNSLAIGYGQFDFGPNFSKLFQALAYLKFNSAAYLIILILGGGVLFLIGYHRSKGFIESEIASTLYKSSEKGENLAYKYWIDYILFGWGLLSLLKNLANQFILPPGHGFDFGVYGLILDVPAPIFFWGGGALFISRLAKSIPSKIDKYILKLRYLADVRVMIFADLRRRTVNTSRIALIIALAISFAVLASVQGTTHEVNIDRQAAWDVGADLQITMTTPAYGSILNPYISNLNVSGISSILPVGKLNGQILNDPLTVYFSNTSQYAKSPYIQSDSFTSGSFNSISGNYSGDAIVGDTVMTNALLNVGDTIDMSVTLLHYNGTTFITSEVTVPIKIVGTFNHIPGGITSSSVYVDYHFIQNLYNTTAAKEFNAYNMVADSSVIAKQLNMNITSSMLNNYYPADMYLIQTKTNADTVEAGILHNMDTTVVSNVYNSISYKTELANSRDLTSSGFGIAGLLTSMFLISLTSATIGVFIFISLLVKSRSKEFAILRALGATERQIYKIALSEVISVLIFALIAGTLLGLGLAYMFNGFFEFMNIFSGTLSFNVPRLLIFPWDTIIISMVITAIIIVLATIIPTRSVAKKEIIEETRQV